MNKIKKLALLSVIGVSGIIFSSASIIAYSQDEHYQIAQAASGQIDPDTYYADINANLTGASLKNALHNKISNRNATGYDYLWEIYKDADVGPDGYIVDIYSNTTKYKPGRDQAGTYSVEGDAYNREHTIPKSWWGGTKPNQGSDPFIVYPSDGKVNGMRSNYTFGTVSEPTYKSNNGYSKLGPNTFPGYSGTAFEPNDEWKGDMARVYFYATTCYNTSGWTTGDGQFIFNGPNFGLTNYAKNLFLDWHEKDPVSAWELQRCNKVSAHSNNRNPFIDHPEWVNQIWGDQTVTPSEPTITIDKNKSLLIGDTYKLTPKLEGMSGTVTYYSENPNVASVNSSGLITGVSQGTTNVVASIVYKGKTYTATCKVTVTKPVVLTGINLSITSTSVEIGSSVQVSATPIPTNAKLEANYISKDPTIATVDSNTGVVNALKEGSVVIEVCDETLTNVKNTITITVIKPQPINGYKKIGENEFKPGKYIIATQADNDLNPGTGSIVALNPNAGGGKDKFSDIDAENNVIKKFDNKLIFNVEKSGTSYVFKQGEKYLNISNKDFSFNTATSAEAPTIDVDFGFSGEVLLRPSGKTGDFLQYNSSASVFRKYGGTQQDLYLYQGSSSGGTTPDPEPGGGENPNPGGGETIPPTPDVPATPIEEQAYPTNGNFYKVSKQEQLESGFYIITAQNGQYIMDSSKQDVANNYLSGSLINGYIAATKNAMVKVIKDGSYFHIMTQGNSSTPYLSSKTGNNNGSSFAASKDATTKMTITINNGDATIVNVENDHPFRFNDNNDQLRFRFYKNLQQSPVQLYKLYSLKDFAIDFNSLVVCDPTGVNAPANNGWTSAKAKYNLLSLEDKQALKTLSITDETMGSALSKYEYIIHKYGESKYENFMSRKISQTSNYVDNALLIKNEIFAISLILSISAVSIAIIVFIHKHRKNKRI